MSKAYNYAWENPDLDVSKDPISQRMRAQKETAEALHINPNPDQSDSHGPACGCGRCLGYWMEPVCPILQQAPEQQVRNWAELVRRYLIKLTFNPKKMKRSKTCSAPPGKSAHSKCKADTCACPCHVLNMIEWGGG